MPAWETFVAVSLGGFGLGLGLVLGAFIARGLRGYMTNQHMQPYYKGEEDDDDDDDYRGHHRHRHH
jgi:hypothetical protein